MAYVIHAGSLHQGAGYFPVAVANELDLFAAQGLDVHFAAPRHGPAATRAVLSGESDIALGGMWRPVLYRDRVGDLVAFAQVCERCYLVLLARVPGTFSLGDLAGKAIVIPSLTPASALYLGAVLAREGVEAADVTFVRDIDDGEALELFRGGLGDYLVAMPEQGIQLERDGVAGMVWHFADAGEVPWSVYYGSRAFIGSHDGEPAKRFAAALDLALAWIHASDRNDRAYMARQCYGDAVDVTAAVIEQCIDKALWPKSSAIPEFPLQKWQEAMVAAKWRDRPIAHSSLVDMRISTQRY